MQVFAIPDMTPINEMTVRGLGTGILELDDAGDGDLEDDIQALASELLTNPFIAATSASSSGGGMGDFLGGFSPRSWLSPSAVSSRPAGVGSGAFAGPAPGGPTGTAGTGVLVGTGNVGLGSTVASGLGSTGGSMARWGVGGGGYAGGSLGRQEAANQGREFCMPAVPAASACIGPGRPFAEEVAVTAGCMPSTSGGLSSGPGGSAPAAVHAFAAANAGLTGAPWTSFGPVQQQQQQRQQRQQTGQVQPRKLSTGGPSRCQGQQEVAGQFPGSSAPGYGSSTAAAATGAAAGMGAASCWDFGASRGQGVSRKRSRAATMPSYLKQAFRLEAAAAKQQQQQQQQRVPGKGMALGGEEDDQQGKRLRMTDAAAVGPSAGAGGVGAGAAGPGAGNSSGSIAAAADADQMDVAEEEDLAGGEGEVTATQALARLGRSVEWRPGGGGGGAGGDGNGGGGYGGGGGGNGGYGGSSSTTGTDGDCRQGRRFSRLWAMHSRWAEVVRNSTFLPACVGRLDTMLVKVLNEDYLHSWDSPQSVSEYNFAAEAGKRLGCLGRWACASLGY